MNSLINIASRLVNRPLMVTPAKLEAVLSILGQRLSPAVIDETAFSGPSQPQMAMESAAASSSRQPGQGGRVANATIAVIPVIGSLVHRGSMNSWSGLRSYQAIRQDIRAARKDPDVDAIMLDCDSHGGEVSGCFDLVDEIYQARQDKPVYAFARESAYSAGYAIFSAAEKTFVSRTSGVGSIGVIIVHADQSEFNKKIGVKYTAVYAGARKNDFTPHEPLSKEAKAILESEAQSSRQIFIDTVARNRDMSKEDVSATEAAFYTGQAAVEAGLADAVATWEEALADLAGAVQTTLTGGSKMNTQDRFAALLKSQGDADEALANLGFVRADATATDEAIDKAKAEATVVAKKEAMADAATIVQLCTLADLPEMSQSMIEDNCSVGQVQSRLLEHKAKLDDGLQTTSTVSGAAATVDNTFISACAAAAGKGGA